MAGCSEEAYTSLKLEHARQLLMFDDNEVTSDYAAQVRELLYGSKPYATAISLWLSWCLQMLTRDCVPTARMGAAGWSNILPATCGQVRQRRQVR